MLQSGIFTSWELVTLLKGRSTSLSSINHRHNMHCANHRWSTIIRELHAVSSPSRTTTTGPAPDLYPTFERSRNRTCSNPLSDSPKAQTTHRRNHSAIFRKEAAEQISPIQNCGHVRLYHRPLEILLVRTQGVAKTGSASTASL